ncbi:hypothetical protein Tco_0633740 [Tanacetum coccineum]
MDDPNITMDEYIRLEEEKARRRGKVFNWETATYAIVFNETLTSEAALSCEPTVSPLNVVIDFRISFDESDNEDCTDEDNDDDKIDIEHSSGDLSVIPLPNVINNNDRTRMSIPTFQVKMDDPNITMDEYIRLEEEKARRLGKCLTGKLLRMMLTSEAALSCEPTVSPLNDEIDFRISFDESDDEDCTVNMPLLPSPEPTVSYFNDLDYFNDFEKEFPAIIYNDAQTSKLDFLTEPTLNPQHIDEFDLKDETSLSECDEVDQNVLYFNDLFSFNVIYPDDSKSDEDNDDDKIDIEHSSGDLSVIPLPNVINNNDGAYAHASNKLLETINTAAYSTQVSIRRIMGNGYGVSTSCIILEPRERNIDEYWCRIYESGNLEVLES